MIGISIKIDFFVAKYLKIPHPILANIVEAIHTMISRNGTFIKIFFGIVIISIS